MTVASQGPIGASLSGGRYSITAKLGEGGMGAVYRALDNNIQADVVIKVPHPSMLMDAEFARRFREEVKSLVRLSHPHIVKVTDVGDWDGVPFAVLQFLPGGSLEDRLSAWHGPAALASLGSWVGLVAGALDYVHSQKMVHRDVKPGNILFDSQGHAFLGDFGVVKVMAAAADDRSSRTAMTGTGMVLGTPHYMAPELVMGDPFDGRVDQYALAVTAYELLCGRRPFEHEVTTRVLMMQTRDEPPSPSQFCASMPPRLEEALLKGLAKEPKDRYPNCAAFAAALIEAAGVGQAGRARLRCMACGQTLTISVEALAKLSRGGRNAPCPKCKGVLDLAAGTVTVLPPTPSGASTVPGTSVLDVHGSTAEMRAVRPPAGVGTVVLGSGRLKTSPEPEAATFAVGPVGTTVIAARREPSATAGEDPKRPPLPWLPIGIGAAALVLVAGGAVVWGTMGRRSTTPEPPVVRSSAVVPPVVLAARDDGSKMPTQVPKGPPGGPLAGSNPSANPRTEPSRSRVENANDGNAPDDDGRSGLLASNSNAARRVPTQKMLEPKTPQAPEDETVPDDVKPSPRNLPLGKLLANPEAYAGKLVTLEQTYCVGTTPWRMPDGSLRVALIESDLELMDKSARVRMRNSFELDLDRRFADQLKAHGQLDGIVESRPNSPRWIMKPANLTVRVFDSPAGGQRTPARIVRIEFFNEFKNEVRGTAKRILVVRYQTETVTATGKTSGFGIEDEWKKTTKLGHAHNQFQRFFEGMRSAASQMRWAAFSSQMNKMITEGTRQAAAADAANQNRVRQSMLPR